MKRREITVNDLIDSAKMRANIESDYALAKVLGVERQIISGWRKDKRHPSNEEAVKLATLAGVNEMDVIAAIELQTAKTDEKKKFWKHYIESRGVTACLAMTALAISVTVTPEPAQAAPILQSQNYGAQNSDFLSSEIYIMRMNLSELIG